ncbi:hypothetical protein SDC9_165734 [bioreactor metagenome]|uniref:Uncharacterized protein n=1 Tax=bioreactor metagenome TaxID=1076179 RepID=A0A645G2L3_9ZZZZ
MLGQRLAQQGLATVAGIRELSPSRLTPRSLETGPPSAERKGAQIRQAWAERQIRELTRGFTLQCKRRPCRQARPIRRRSRPDRHRGYRQVRHPGTVATGKQTAFSHQLLVGEQHRVARNAQTGGKLPGGGQPRTSSQAAGQDGVTQTTVQRLLS